jgi:hypothetical protein
MDDRQQLDKVAELYELADELDERDGYESLADEIRREARAMQLRVFRGTVRS